MPTHTLTWCAQKRSFFLSLKRKIGKFSMHHLHNDAGTQVVKSPYRSINKHWTMALCSFMNFVCAVKRSTPSIYDFSPFIYSDKWMLEGQFLWQRQKRNVHLNFRSLTELNWTQLNSKFEERERRIWIFCGSKETILSVQNSIYCYSIE